MHVIIKNIGEDTLRITALDQDGKVAGLEGKDNGVDKLLGPGNGADLDGLPDDAVLVVQNFRPVMPAEKPKPEAKDGDQGVGAAGVPAGTNTDGGLKSMLDGNDPAPGAKDAAGIGSAPEGEQTGSPTPPATEPHAVDPTAGNGPAETERGPEGTADAA